MQLKAQLGALSDLVSWIRPLTSGTEGGNVLKKGGREGGRGEVEEEEKKERPPQDISIETHRSIIVIAPPLIHICVNELRGSFTTQGRHTKPLRPGH